MINTVNSKFFRINIKIVKTTNSRANLFEYSKLLKSMTNAFPKYQDKIYKI